MAYTPENNPYIPGDPYSYDLKWMVQQIKKWAAAYESLEAAFKALSENFDDLKKYVDSFFDDLDVQEEINNKLDEMMADGTLASIINQALELHNWQREATLCRKMRFLDPFGYTNTTRTLYGQSCTFGNSLFYVCGSFNSNADQSISVYNASGTLVDQAFYTTLGHANDIHYDQGYLYVATGTDIVKINASDLSIDSVITITGVSTVPAVTGDGAGILYIFGVTTSPMQGVVKYDIANATEELILDNIDFANNAAQGICYHNGKLFLSYVQGNQIYQLDLSTGLLDYVFNIPQTDGWFYVMEPEAPLVVNDRMYLMSTGWGVASGVDYDAAVVQIFDTDILNPLEIDNKMIYQEGASPQYIQVNASATPGANPVNIFTTLEECILIAKKRTIRIVSSISNGAFYSLTGTVDILRMSGTVQLGHIRIYGGTLRIDGCTVDKITAEGGVIFLHQCTVNAGSFRFCEVHASLTNILSYLSVERSTVSLEHPGIDNFSTGGAPSAYSSFSYVNECGALTTAQFATVYLNHIELFANYSATTQHRFEFVAEDSAGKSYPLAFRAPYTSLAAGVSESCGDYDIAITSAGVISLSSGGTPISLSAIYDLKIALN